jgi:superkiller protein 3
VETPQQKFFSVTIDLNTFDAIDGKLANLTDEVHRKEYITSFFLQKYGQGGGKLEIELNNMQVKLKWLPSKVDSHAEHLHKEALFQARHRKFKEAINNWVRAISVNSNDPDYYFNLGIAFFELKNYQESVENLKKAISLCPIYYKAHLILGTVYLKIRKYEEAEKYLKASISFYPNHALSYLNLGATYSILKRYDESIEMFNKTIQLAPKEVRAHFGLGKIYSIKGMLDKANQCFKNVIEFDTKGILASHAKRAMAVMPSAPQKEIDSSLDGVEPKFAEKFYQDGYKAFLLTDYDRASEMYRRYLKIKPEDDFVWYALGETNLRAGNIEQAVEAFKSAIKYSERKGLYFKELAIAFDCLNKSNEAIECLKKAQELGKNDSITNTIWGKHLIKQERFSDAIEHLEKALKLNTTNLLAKYYLALALMRNGEVDAGTNYLQEIIRTPINSPLKKDAEKILNKIRHD